MGQVYSFLFRRRFKVNATIEGQDQSAIEIFHALGLTNEDIDLLYTAFWDIDADESGLIRPIELFHYFEVEGNKFEWGVFTLFDEDGSGMINFMEFVCTLWNLLTLPEPAFGSLAYLMRDPSATGSISFTDVQQILEMMHGKRADRDNTLHFVFNHLKKDLQNKLSLQQFTNWAAANPYVTSPIMMLQLHIRRQILGEPYWIRLTHQRGEHDEQRRLDYVKRLQQEVIQRNQAFQDKLQREEAARLAALKQARTRIEDYRDHVERKQSMVLRYFRLQAVSFIQPSQGQHPRGYGQRRSLVRVHVSNQIGEVANCDPLLITGQEAAGSAGVGEEEEADAGHAGSGSGRRGGGAKAAYDKVIVRKRRSTVKPRLVRKDQQVEKGKEKSSRQKKKGQGEGQDQPLQTSRSNKKEAPPTSPQNTTSHSSKTSSKKDGTKKHSGDEKREDEEEGGEGAGVIREEEEEDRKRTAQERQEQQELRDRHNIYGGGHRG